MTSRLSLFCGASLVALMCTGGTTAQDWKSSYTLYGTPGLIEMPTAGVLPDGQVAATYGQLGPHRRTTVTFQATPRITASFRYARMENLDTDDLTYYDRSLDLHFLLMKEGRNRPAVALGLRDFLGTGLYSSEYLVASKSFGPRIQATAGIGWGQLGSRGGFDNPLAAVFGDSFRDRTLFDLRDDTGGTLNDQQFFRGDAAVFGGLEYTISPTLRFKVEYSSDEYQSVNGKPVIDQKTPLNFGISWSPHEAFHAGAYLVNGTELGFGVTVALDPNSRSFAPPAGKAPIPVAPRAGRAAAASWTPSEATTRQFGEAFAQAMKTEGLVLRGVEARGNTLRIRYENTRYLSEAQAMGRLARLLSHAAAPGVDYFELEVMEAGVPVSNVRLSRAQLERLENEQGAADRMFAATQISDARSAEGLVRIQPEEEKLVWGISPYFGYTLFDLEDAIQLQAGLEATARYEITPNLVVSGRVRYRAIDNLSEPEVKEPRGGVPVVRRDSSQFGRENRLTLEELTLTHFGRLTPNVYTRASIGYLEKMYGGVSLEALWKPATSRLALGAELNYAVKRDYDLGFGFQDYDTVSGHISAYYDFENDYVGQVDVGRYLAGDWGATVSLDRVFPNGWRVGGYFTLTDIPFEDFGTGSFDKGIRVTIPTDWLTGRPSRSVRSANLSMGTRDGGQRVDVGDRLYPIISAGHETSLEDSWGRFWQ